MGFKKLKNELGKKYRHQKRKLTMKMRFGNHKYHLPDQLYIKLLFRLEMGYRLNLRHPKTFSEKLNWLKLYNRRPEYTMMVDKYAVRKYIADTIGEEYLVPLVGAWDSADEIDFSALPEKCVLKPNHMSDVYIKKGSSYYTKEGKEYTDTEILRKKLNQNLRENYFYHSREWPYKDVPRKIICEKYMENKCNSFPFEYKFFCFNGKIGYLEIIQKRFTKSELTLNYVDEQYNNIDLKQNPYENCDTIPSRIQEFDGLKNDVLKLCKNVPFIRVDFNIWNDKPYFGELTFYPTGGFVKYEPSEWNETLGSWIDISKI